MRRQRAQQTDTPSWFDSQSNFVRAHTWRPRLRRRCRLVWEGCACAMPHNPQEWKEAAVYHPGIRVWPNPRKDSPCSCTEGEGWTQLCTKFQSYYKTEPKRLNYTSLAASFSLGHSIPLSITNFAPRSLSYLRLMHTIDTTKLLGNYFFIELAMERCANFLQLKHSSQDLLVPPLDVMCVWSALMIRNFEFMEMCADHGVLIRHEDLVVCSREGQVVVGSASPKDIARTQQAYAAKFKKDLCYNLDTLVRTELPFLESLPEPAWLLIYEYMNPLIERPPVVFHGAIEQEQEVKPLPLVTLRIQEYLTPYEIVQDRQWWPMLLRSLGKEESLRSAVFPLSLIDIQAAQRGYEEFLLFASSLHYRGCVIDLDRFVGVQQDIFWHTHMMHPALYQKDCLQVVGVTLYHDPWPQPLKGAKMDQAQAGFVELWKSWQQRGVK